MHVKSIIYEQIIQTKNLNKVTGRYIPLKRRPSSEKYKVEIK